MKTGERQRLTFVFGLFGLVTVFLIGWLGYVQVAHAAELQRDGRAPLRLDFEAGARQGRHLERTPAPRGTIVDRNGARLAYDREVYEVRASLTTPKKLRKDFDEYRAWLGRRAHELALALASDRQLADRQKVRIEHEARLLQALRKAYRVDDLERGPAGMLGVVPEDHRRHVEIRVAGNVEVLSVIEALRELGGRRELRGLLKLHFLPAYCRVYPDRELTYGLVGHTSVLRNVERQLTTYGMAGLEAMVVLGAGRGAERRFLVDGRGKPYFVAKSRAGSAVPVVHSTIDLDLQRAAVRELEVGIENCGEKLPQWAALVMVEVATGDIVAAASWHRGRQPGAEHPFNPYQSLFEPGSIVKPLVLAYAYEAGTIDWHHTFDCRPDGRDYRAQIRGLGRKKRVSDDHVCGDLTAHEIIVNSSNIGASLVGLTLSREQWQDYMDFFGIGKPLGLPMPYGSVGGPNKRSFRAGVPERRFRANSAISFSFGYEHMVTALHMARAYLRLLRGGGAELRACRGVECEGQYVGAPVSPDGASFSPRVRGAVQRAITDVLSSAEGATGRFLNRKIEQELGIDIHGLIAGKTGTAVSSVSGGVVRNASFVGMIPADRPRWLAVCVMQRDDRARFYGGSYAAPPVVRLLLQAQ